MGKNFGYTIHSDRQIDFDRNDPTLIDYLIQKEPTIQTCIACGSCTATCTAGQFVDFNIRRVHTFLRRREITGLRQEIAKCMLCGKCQLVCPRGVNLRNLILSIHYTVQKLAL